MLFLLRLPRVVFVLMRGGLLGHMARSMALPGWLAGLCRGADWLFARKLRTSGTAQPPTGRPGLALAEALNTLGPGFIKLGQALSTRADLLGAEAAADLASLQDSLPPFPGHQARRMISTTLGKPLEEVFAEFDDTPVAAASIAQVHFARLADGTAVAVKVLRPHIRQKMARDIRLFRGLARLMEYLAPQVRPLKLTQAVDQFARISDIELDLRLEAAAAAKLRENHAHDEGIYIPRIFWGATTERMLVLERVRGIRIDDRAGLLAAGHDIDAITATAARCFFVQVFRDGYFHADMHPGNIFIRADGVLVPVDFGIMGALNLQDRLFLVRLLNAMLERDYDAVAHLHAEAGMIGRHVPARDFAQAVRAVAEPVMDKPMAAVSLGAVLGQIFGLARRFQIEVQPQYNLLQKTMVMAEGTGRQLNPEANMWPIARTLAADWARDQQGAGAQLSSLADKMLTLGLRMPSVLEKAENALDHVLAGHQPVIPPPTAREARRNGGIYLLLGAILVILLFILHRLW